MLVDLQICISRSCFPQMECSIFIRLCCFRHIENPPEILISCQALSDAPTKRSCKAGVPVVISPVPIALILQSIPQYARYYAATMKPSESHPRHDLAYLPKHFVNPLLRQFFYDHPVLKFNIYHSHNVTAARAIPPPVHEKPLITAAYQRTEMLTGDFSFSVIAS